MIPVERKGAMRSPGITPTNLEINPEFAARFRAHQPTKEQLDAAIRLDLRSAGEFRVQPSEIVNITHTHEDNLVGHIAAEQDIVDLVQRRKDLLDKQNEAAINKYIDTDELQQALDDCDEELTLAIKKAVTTADHLPSQLAVKHHFNSGTDRMEWDHSKK